MKRYIRSTELGWEDYADFIDSYDDMPDRDSIPEYSNEVVPGMYWCNDEFTFTVTDVNGSRATVEETWISYDTGKDMKKVHKYRISSDDGSEYVYDPKDPEWRFYASSAFGVVDKY